MAETGILAGEDAVVSTADLLYQAMRNDDRFSDRFDHVDLSTFASTLRDFLATAFKGNAWPALEVSPALVESRFDDFSDALREALEKSVPLDSEPMVYAVQCLSARISYIFSICIRLCFLSY